MGAKNKNVQLHTPGSKPKPAPDGGSVGRLRYQHEASLARAWVKMHFPEVWALLSAEAMKRYPRPPGSRFEGLEEVVSKIPPQRRES